MDDLVQVLRSGLDNCDSDSRGLELGGVVAAMKAAADEIERLQKVVAEVDALANQLTLQKAVSSSVGSLLLDVQRDCIAEHKRADAAEAEVRVLRAKLDAAEQAANERG